jgi:hypothetical protein
VVFVDSCRSRANLEHAVLIRQAPNAKVPLNTPNEFKGMHADAEGPYVGHFQSMEVALQTDEAPPTTPKFQGSTVPETSLLQAGTTLAKEAFYQSGWKNRRRVDYKFALNPNGDVFFF